MTMDGRELGTLVHSCDGCGAPNGVLLESRDGYRDYQCPRCTQNLALYSAARDHLEVLYREATEIFASVWGTVPTVMSGLHEIVWHAGVNISEELKEGQAEVPAEGVRPADLLNAAD